ncbi:MAG: MoxR family ATPase [Planctomycetes bacterium]|nr:MoxR family ATPase [Planctomycetota bacterium]
MADVKQQAAEFAKIFNALRTEIGKVIVGHEEIVENVLICVFAQRNCLLEGVPGLGKTLLVRTLAQTLDLPFSRIQFTPDLMPADIIGTDVITGDEKGGRAFRFQPGPVFSNIVLADEINRATPKTQSALLEAMQEHSVTVGGKRYILKEPFFVLATQNPLEQEGTYPLPEAQLDRFLFKLLVHYSTREQLNEVVLRTTRSETADVRKVLDGAEIMKWGKFALETILAPHIRDYAVRVCLATHPGGEFAPEIVNKYVRWGSSPRGAQGLILAAKIKALLDGRYHVSFDDVARSARPTLRHRLILNFEGEADGISPDNVVDTILKHTPREVEMSVA